MMEHPAHETLHDLLDGELSADAEADVRAHLDGCAACRETLRGFSSVVEGLGALPRAAATPGHLWGGIAARIGAPEADTEAEEAEVLPFPAPARRTRRFSLSVPQLAAAAALVALISAGTVWMALAPAGAPVTGPPAVAESPDPGGAAARAASTGAAGYDRTIRELERMVEAGEDVLAPETLATLEVSLQTVDEALAEVRRALAEDPGSELLHRLLAGHQTTKVRVLRQAVTAIQAQS